MSQLLQIAGSFKNLAYTALPILVPMAWRSGNKVYHTLKSPKYRARIHPISARNLRVVLVLAAATVALLLFYTPIARASEFNIFQITESRLQTPIEVVATRFRVLYAAPGAEGGQPWLSEAQARMPRNLRKAAAFTTEASWERFFARLTTLEGRVLYTGYGSNAFLHCDFCRTDAPWTFFLYVLPAILAPYIANLGLVLMVTRGPRNFITTTQSAQWTSIFVTITIVLAVLDVALFYSFPTTQFAMQTRHAVSRDAALWIYREAHKYRAIFLALVDASLAFVVWLAGTGRLWDNSFTEDGYYRSTQRAVQALDMAVQRLRVSTMLHSHVIARNKDFRTAYEQWGELEQLFDQKLREAPKVKEARKSAQQRKAALLRNVEAEAQNLIEKL
ncbi:uncharacterized protein SAPINGB_P002386 [Magnusiomyces paraingens]|uniref:Uncharacterized protein n=1 Tax=Magnusiomyces paraingens TaxID=2606893 RepID=A0A5E8BDM0_9ASCO|nr:uncharacterized protein SAPINGB_P002386 [Saprochaete ingens]VVT49673.1 unnamed protein product [Saprochaete ingens]